jgi:heptosyltransferase I
MRSLLPLSKSPKKICILRLSALGDVTHVVPLLRQIQIEWPDCEITWVCGAFEYKFLKLIDGVRFVPFNKKDGFSAYLKLRKDLGGEQFDVLLHMQVAARANIASLFIKAKIRLGWDRKRSRDLHHLFINSSVPQALMQHQQEGFLSFGTILGLPPSAPKWSLPITDDAKQFLKHNLVNVKPLMVISACSSHKLRNWSPEKYAEVADYAIQKYGMQVVLSGGPSQVEIEVSELIESKMNCDVVNLVGKDTLEQLIGLLDRADVVLSPDSGPAHLANAVGTKVIGLYACTWSKRSGPYNSLEYCVDKFEQAAMNCLGKSAKDLFWGTKIEREGVMDLILVEDVCSKLDSIMSSV